MPRPPALPPSSVSSRVMVCCGLPTQRNNISGVGKVQPHMSCAAEGRLCEVRPIPHGLYSSQPRDQRPAIPLPSSSPPLNHHQSIKNARPLICIPVNIVFANGPSENTACMLSSVSICLLWFESSSVTVMERTKFCVLCICEVGSFEIVSIVCLGPFSMRSTLLSHSEWAQWAAPGLERRPCKNGAGTAS